MKRLLITAILLLLTTGQARADFDITALPDHTAPATANDGLVVYKYAAAEGSRVQEVKASADAGQCLSGTWTWVSFQPLDSALTQFAGLTLSRGDILFYNGSTIINLGPGTAGQLLQTNGVGADPTWTSAIALDVFGLPNGVSPTVDEAGEAAVDTTSDQLVLYGGAKRVISYKNEKPFTLESPVAADDNVPIWHPGQAITITDVHCEVDGGTSVELIISDGTNALETITCDDDGADDDGTIANGTFTANERMEFDIGTVVGTNTWLSWTITYNITAD